MECGAVEGHAAVEVQSGGKASQEFQASKGASAKVNAQNVSNDFIKKRLGQLKQLTAKKREDLAKKIQEKARAWAIGRAEVEEIDRLNIFQASLLAMQRAVSALMLRPRLVLIDE